ncbi:MAG: PQQ-binding-like beta-propeller repeat protein, partial [Planococcaceae bacterium]|nr:PQQ-binding-like beta-propeller repeat protein [Planococcaceae bacterium]
MKNNKAMYAIITGIIVVITALVILIVTYGPKEVKDIIDPSQNVAKDNDENKLTTKDSGIKVEFPESEWSTHGGDLYNRRYSPLEAINVDTIKDLKPAWTTSLGSGIEFKYSGEATPLVADGVMYVTTGANDVLALDAITGEMLWDYRPEIDEKLDTVCCGWTNRGVAIGEGKVYATLLDARLVALDIKTGEVIWETEVANWQEGYTVTNAPLYYNGKVYTGVAGGEFGIRGRMTAYDSDNGREIWRFNTIPGPGDYGFDTWPADNDAWMTGGGPVWQTPAVDPELGYIYFATGNTAPDLDGSNREGDNLFANSIMAIDAETGEYKWHFQEVHHDIWDMDPANPVVLYDVEMDGEMKKGIAQAGKTGWVYFLDRTNGEPLVGIEEKEVPQDERQKTAATQPYPVGDSFVPQEVTEEDVKNDLPESFEGEVGGLFDPFWEVPLTIKPSPQGGANWPPSAYNPDTELFYVLGNDNYFSFTRSEEEFDEGSQYIGSVFQPILEAPQRGTVTALDVKTNKIVWQVNWDAIAYSGVLTTKGNLVFVGHNDGRLIAYDAKTGDQVWEYMTDAGVNAPPVTYEIDGVQYISVLAAGNTLAGSKHG